MNKINPIIYDGLKEYLNENPNIPPSVQELVGRMLEVEAHDNPMKEAVDKIYDRILDRYVKDQDLIKWSKDYV